MESRTERRADYFRGWATICATLTCDPNLPTNASTYASRSESGYRPAGHGRYVGRHEGGQSAFVFDITDFLKFDGRDLLRIIVSNAPQIDVMPTAGADISYGGIYRDVDIVVCQPTSISLDDYASDGVYLNPRNVAADKVTGEVQVKIKSRSTVSATAQVTITNALDEVVLVGTTKCLTSPDRAACGNHSVRNRPTPHSGTALTILSLHFQG